MKYLDENYYHVFNRGSRSEKIFFSEANYEYFQRLMTRNSIVHLVRVEAYCLMPNHYHIVIKQSVGGSISKFIQSLMTSYVQAINKMYNLSGTLFQGKAKAKQIDTESSLLQVVRYIHLNPVKAGLVQRPEDWRFSDYREWLGLTSPNAWSDRRGSHRTDWRGLLRSDQRGISLREVLIVNAEEYKQFVEEEQAMQKENNLHKFLINE
jgi:putative transposase